MTMAPCFLDETKVESMDYSPKFQVFNVNPKSCRKFHQAYPSRTGAEKNSTIPADVIHVGFHVDVSFIDDVMGCDPKLPSNKPKVGTCDKSQPMRVQGFSGAMV